MSEYEPRRSIESEIARTPDVEPPAGIVQAVMLEIPAIQARQSWWTKRRRAAKGRAVAQAFTAARAASGGGRQGLRVPGLVVARTRTLVGVAAVAVAAFVSFWAFGLPAIDGGSEGAIGAANRSQGSQIGLKDVKVPDADVQQFLQSETFDRLMQDSRTRAAMVVLFSNEAVAEALSDPKVMEALSDPEVTGSLLAMSRTRVSPLPQSEAPPARSDSAVLDALNEPGVMEALSREGVMEALATPGFREAFGNAAFARALGDAGMRASISAGLAAFGKNR
jgi:hypothetical protein